VYVYAVPKLEKVTSLTTRANYLNSAQKQVILNDVNSTKLATAEVVVTDPVYVLVDLGVKASGEDLAPSIADTTFLQISRSVTARRNPETLKKQIAEIFINYFSTTKDNLGLTISLTDISNSILQIEGVNEINTVRTVNGSTIRVPGVSLLVYNPVYPFDDIAIITQDTALPFFKFPFLNNQLDFINKINVITPSIQSIEREF
jgi:hypothetical protein